MSKAAAGGAVTTQSQSGSAPGERSAVQCWSASDQTRAVQAEIVRRLRLNPSGVPDRLARLFRAARRYNRRIGRGNGRRLVRTQFSKTVVFVFERYRARRNLRQVVPMFEGWDAVVLWPAAQFAFTMSFHIVFPRLLDRACQLSWRCSKRCGSATGREVYHQPVQLLAEDLRRRLRHGRGVGHRDVLPVRHQLVGLLRQDRPGDRPADGL